MKKALFILVSALFIISCASIALAADVPISLNPTFSFASDTYHQGYTFLGSNNGIFSDAQVDLIFDLNNDNLGGLVTFSSQMKFTARPPYNYKVIQIGPQWVHMWKVDAEITFLHLSLPNNPPLLTIKFKEALLTSWSPSPTAIGETMTLQDSESADPSISMFPYPLLNGIGILPECLQRSEDLAFTFTNIRPKGNPGGLTPVDKYGNFMDTWFSEGSFSGSACLDRPILILP